jgi:hypothetical protein
MGGNRESWKTTKNYERQEYHGKEERNVRETRNHWGARGILRNSMNCGIVRGIVREIAL